MSSQYGELRPTDGWDRLASLGHHSKFQRVSRLGFVTAPTSLNGGQPNFAQCLAVFLAGALHIHFWGLMPPNGILPRAKFTLHPSLAFSYIGSVTARHLSAWAVGVTKLCTMIEGLELRNIHSSSFSTEGTTYILRAAIMLGIDPHSSCLKISLFSPPIIPHRLSFETLGLTWIYTGKRVAKQEQFHYLQSIITAPTEHEPFPRLFGCTRELCECRRRLVLTSARPDLWDTRDFSPDLPTLCSARNIQHNTVQYLHT